jgi:carbon monoxide dehydrogenase subunit G
MPDWELSVRVDAPAEEVWAIVGDLASVPRWTPKYVAAEVEGDRRTLRSAEGAVLVERIIEHDDARRTYTYGVLSGAPVREHRASFEVVAEGAGSRVSWRTSAEPADPSADLEGRLRPTQTEALARMRELVEGGDG